MYWKIEPTGCCEKNGRLRIRYCCFLDPNDYQYAKHFVSVKVVPKAIPEKFKGIITDKDVFAEYQKWLAALPEKKQNNPFFSQLVYFDLPVSDGAIDKKGDEILAEAYRCWCLGIPVRINHKHIDESLVITAAIKEGCKNRIECIKARVGKCL